MSSDSDEENTSQKNIICTCGQTVKASGGRYHQHMNSFKHHYSYHLEHREAPIPPDIQLLFDEYKKKISTNNKKQRERMKRSVLEPE